MFLSRKQGFLNYGRVYVRGRILWKIFILSVVFLFLYTHVSNQIFVGHIVGHIEYTIFIGDFRLLSNVQRKSEKI